MPCGSYLVILLLLFETVTFNDNFEGVPTSKGWRSTTQFPATVVGSAGKGSRYVASPVNRSKVSSEAGNTIEPPSLL